MRANRLDLTVEHFDLAEDVVPLFAGCGFALEQLLETRLLGERDIFLRFEHSDLGVDALPLRPDRISGRSKLRALKRKPGRIDEAHDGAGFQVLSLVDVEGDEPPRRFGRDDDLDGLEVAVGVGGGFVAVAGSEGKQPKREEGRRKDGRTAGSFHRAPRVVRYWMRACKSWSAWRSRVSRAWCSALRSIR